MAVSFAWGIDIGNRALKAVKLVRDDSGGLRVDDFEVIEHEHVLSNSGDNREALIQSALQNFVQRHQIKGGAVAIGVSGQSSFARFIKLPPVEDKKIPEIVRFEAIQQIPFPLDDVEWSYQLFRDAESPDVEVGIFAMRKELVNQHIKYFTDVDLNVQTVQMSPLAVYNAMYYDKRIEGATMIIDLGAENTDLIIAEGETIWMRSIPIGGNNFTEALVKSFKLSFDKAEDLKRTAATSKYARQIFQAMRPVFADLVAEVQRSIGFYASVHRESRIKKIITLGGTFRLPGLQKYLQQNLQLEVERIDGLVAGAPSDGKLATLFSENLLSTISAYGLAIQAMGEGKISSSLLPEAIRRERLWKEKTKWFAAAAALFVLGTAIGMGAFYTQRMSYQAAEPKRQEIERIQKQATDLDNQWANIERSGEEDRRVITDIRSLENYRDFWSQLLIDIDASLPKPQWSPVDDVKAMKAIKRTDRNQILIESVRSQYRSDISPYMGMNDVEFKKHADSSTAVAAPSAGGFEGGGPMRFPGGPGGPPGAGPKPSADEGSGAAAAAGVRGFLITIKGVTPNGSGYALVDKSFVKALETIKQSASGPHSKYYIARATTISAQQIRQDQNKMSAMQTAFTSATKSPDLGQGQPQKKDPNPGEVPRPAVTFQGVPLIEVPGGPFADRVTGEDVHDDWEFTVLVAVVIDPPPMPATPAGGAPGAQHAAGH